MTAHDHASVPAALAWSLLGSEAPAATPLPDGQVDLAIVGGGLAGCSAACKAAESGLSVVLLEKHQVGSGQSGASGGQFIPAFENDAQTLIERYGLAVAGRLLRASEDALRALEALLEEEGATALGRGGLVLGLSREDSAYLDQEGDALGLLRVPHERLGNRIREFVGSSAYTDGLYMPGTRHGNPLAVVRTLASRARRLGAGLHEHTPALGLVRLPHGGWRVDTPRGPVHARHVFLAGGDSLLLKHRWFAPTVLVRTWSVATELLPWDLASRLVPSGACGYDVRELTMDYFRMDDSRLLLGGGDSIAAAALRGKSYLSARVTQLFPELEGVKLTHCWSEEADVSASRMPVFRHAEGLWSAGGYSGCGTVNAFGAGRWVVEALTGEAPSRGPSNWTVLENATQGRTGLRVFPFPAHHGFRRMAGRLGASILEIWS